MLSQSHRSRHQELYGLCANAFSNVSRMCLFLSCLHFHMHSPFRQPLTLSSHSGACPFGASATRTAAMLKHCVMIITFCSPRKSAPARSFARRAGRKASSAVIYPQRGTGWGGTDIMRQSAWGRGGEGVGESRHSVRQKGGSRLGRSRSCAAWWPDVTRCDDRCVMSMDVCVSCRLPVQPCCCMCAYAKANVNLTNDWTQRACWGWAMCDLGCGFGEVLSA